jgi:hypothetical protein
MPQAEAKGNGGNMLASLGLRFRQQCQFLDACTKMRKATMSFGISVCLSVSLSVSPSVRSSVRPSVRIEQLGFKCTDVRGI